MLPEVLEGVLDVCVPITGISWLTVLVSSRIRILNGELWALAIWKGMYVLAVM